MRLLRRLLATCRRFGLRVALVKAYVVAADYWFDIRFRTDTTGFRELGDLTIVGSNRRHGTAYQPTRFVPLRRLLERLRPSMPDEAVLLDLGCGKGRVLMVASEFEFREVRGVEFAHELCVAARRNIASYRRWHRRATVFEVVESDVLDYAVRPEENVFFLFNPFDGVILKRVIANIAASIDAAPRTVLIVYFNPLHEDALALDGRFRKERDVRIWDYHFAVYADAPRTRAALPGAAAPLGGGFVTPSVMRPA